MEINKSIIEKFCNNRIAELERDDLIHHAQKAFGIREAKKMLKFISEQWKENETRDKALPINDVILCVECESKNTRAIIGNITYQCRDCNRVFQHKV